jgi:Cu(I)/Ag(I) efflux system outer membrane protein
LAALLVSACSLAPRYERPPAPVPPLAGDPGSAEAAVALPPLAEFLPEARLKALIEAALRENRDLALASLKVREALAQYGVAFAERLPMLEAEGGVEVSGGGGGRRTTEQYEAGLSFPSFEIDFFQRVANMSQAAREDWLASVEAARMVRLGLLGSVAGAYLDTRLAAERLRLTERTLSSLRSSMAFVNERIVSGQSSLLDLEQARAMVAFAEAELAARRLEIARSDSALRLLLGDFGEMELPPPAPILSWPDVSLPEGLPSATLLSRPDILEAEHMLIASHADIGAARAAFFPRLSLTGALGFMSMELASLFDDGNDQWSYRPLLTIPLFAGGRNRANLELAEVRREMAVVTYEMAVQGAFKEVHEGLSVRRLLADRVQAQRRYVSAQRRVLELATSRYQSGVISYLEVLEAQRNVFDAEMALLELRREQLYNDLSLYVALGGGFPEDRSTLDPGYGRGSPPDAKAPGESGAGPASEGGL